MRRIKLTLEYDGTPFHGFQKQDNLPTVQSHLEAAIHHITKEHVATQVAGRTDAGVHALGQVVHFDVETDKRLLVFKDGINNQTPPEIMVTRAEHVDENFQARFDATGRRYRFVIFNRREASPLWLNRAAHFRPQLDEGLMQAATNLIVGEHDFSSFRYTECQAKTPMCHVDEVQITRDGDVVIMEIQANRFLHNMVRILAGTLCLVGCGKISVDEFEEILHAKDRTKAGKTLPPGGLYLKHIFYPEHNVYESC